MFSTVDSLDSVLLYIETTSLSFKRKPKLTKIEFHKMSDFSSLVAHDGSKCSDEEWTEYCRMELLENDLLPVGGKHLTCAKRLFRYLNGTTYPPENGFAICYKCNQLVYIGKKVGGYNHGGILKY
ncbi:hypothetical protein Glove_108g38 [Diversispora epigaea]|uniref:Uncharacterized protein n=1 Tax=Diversispora epigaea TaxID=1348612 RepID=A0A397JBS5_9GLOM|nr:hypothetical protein Glove_108g38 [Diversispora epigaea]